MKLGSWICLAAALPLTAQAYAPTRTDDGERVFWCARQISWWINEAGSDDLEYSALLEAVQASFATWAEPACTDLAFTFRGVTREKVGFEPGGPNRNVVLWREDPEEWVHSPDAVGLTTVTFCVETGGGCDRVGEILDADIELNGAYFEFTTRDAGVLYDVQNTVTHEVGHLLGFEHTPEPEATMFARAPVGEKSKRTLHEDDLQGLCETYGADVPVCTANERIASSSDDGGCRSTPLGAPGWLLPLLLLWGLRRRR